MVDKVAELELKVENEYTEKVPGCCKQNSEIGGCGVHLSYPQWSWKETLPLYATEYIVE